MPSARRCRVGSPGPKEGALPLPTPIVPGQGLFYLKGSFGVFLRFFVGVFDAPERVSNLRCI